MENNYWKVKGRIFDIQKFSVHDGPGIRTIVFLKGCYLRCRWCCNPESQEYSIQNMVANGKNKIIGQDVTVEEVMEKVVQDMPYYRRSGGGLTLSGGETFCQPEFAKALFMASKELGINTAVETTGFAKFGVIDEILPYIDTVLMDIKHMNSEKHKKFTTQPNDLILQNAVIISKKAKKLIIRVPVIPGFNDEENEISDIAIFAKSLLNVNELHILPYHRLGKDKYDGLNRDYLMGDVKPPTGEKMNRLKEVVERIGLQCYIGG